MPNCVYPTQYPLGMLVPFTPTSKPKETHLHQLYLYYWGLLVHIVLGPYPGLLRPALIHCTQHPSSFWLVSIVLSIPWACLYLLYSSYSVFFRPACTHPTHIQGLLRPACIHHTQCSLGLLMPIVSTSMPIQACLYPSCKVWLGPACTCRTHIQASSGLFVSIVPDVPWACSYPL